MSAKRSFKPSTARFIAGCYRSQPQRPKVPVLYRRRRIGALTRGSIRRASKICSFLKPSAWRSAMVSFLPYQLFLTYLLSQILMTSHPVRDVSIVA